jgi:hypothetical protein
MIAMIITTTTTAIIMFLFLSGPANISIALSLFLTRSLGSLTCKAYQQNGATEHGKRPKGRPPAVIVRIESSAWGIDRIKNDATPKQSAAVKAIVSKGSQA